MAINQPDPIKLVHTMAHALRHDPLKYGLDPDAEGWVSFDDLIIAIRYERREFMNIKREDILDILTAMESDRFEIAGTKIRAVYGHSIVLEKLPIALEPPEFLFHGTAEELMPEVMAKGLLRMGRRFAHLSSDIDWVLRFLANKPQWVVLRILAHEAHKKGICFRQANGHVWLVDSIGGEFLRIESSGIGNINPILPTKGNLAQTSNTSSLMP